MSIKYREGDRERFWIHAETTDKLMLFATDGRFFTLDCAKLPGGRGNGEAIRTFIDLPPEADLVSMFVHKDGRKLLLAATSGHGFVTNEDDAVATQASGKQVMNVPRRHRSGGLCVRRGRSGRGDRREPQASDLPARRSARAGARARRYPAALQGWRPLDACVFAWKEGFKDENNRNWPPSELKDWKGERAQAGRIVPRGFAKSGKFGRSTP